MDKNDLYRGWDKNDLYRGWVTITHLKDGVYTTTKEFKSWNSYFDLVSELGLGVVEFKISATEEGYKL